MHDLFSMFKDEATIKIMVGTAWTAISFFCGAYVGHRFNLFRDKRKEFNDAAAPARKILMSQLHKIESGTGVLPMLQQDMYWVIRDNTRKGKRKKLDRLWENYCASNDGDWRSIIDDAGSASILFTNKSNYVNNIKGLLDFTDKR